MLEEYQNDNTFFMPSMFEETLDLLLVAHEYFTAHGTEDQFGKDAKFCMLYSGEMSRITMRLSSIMAWLMVRKAVFLGKMTHEEALHNYALQSREACLLERPECEILPDSMNELLMHSRELYSRVLRLDSLLAATG